MARMCNFVCILVVLSIVYSQQLSKSPDISRFSRSPRFHKHHGNLFSFLGGGNSYHETPNFKPNIGFGSAASQSQSSAGGAQAQAQSQSLFFGFGPFIGGLTQSQAQAQVGQRRSGFDYYDY
ncbi:hypothetical protein WA026_011727 [Henosepilachna vigintioctopunctata]|uniref:Uncharacterized protein n=1 Tax=Henosepilachna vigintioctopunctata TaxID=420089 RepID=A0AAW1U9U7_9CUCU